MHPPPCALHIAPLHVHIAHVRMFFAPLQKYIAQPILHTEKIFRTPKEKADLLSPTVSVHEARSIAFSVSILIQ